MILKLRFQYAFKYTYYIIYNLNTLCIYANPQVIDNLLYCRKLTDLTETLAILKAYFPVEKWEIVTLMHTSGIP